MIRRGSILIVVAGIAALLASLAVAFLISVRSSAAGSEAVVRDAQVRLMLHAACAYVLEAGRLGYGPDHDQAAQPATVAPGSGFVAIGNRTMHREAFGWIDVREADGQSFASPGLPGPRDQLGAPVYQPGTWPAVGGTVLCPMYRWTRPPFAIQPTVAPNPILIDDAQRMDAAWGRPLQRAPTVQPSVDNGWPGTVDDARWSDFVHGDARPVESSTGSAWFRVHRRTAATFIVTCGSGGTFGFADWDEVVAPGALAGAPGGAELFGDRAAFAELRAGERRAWYEIRWSGAIRPPDFRYEEALWFFDFPGERGGWLQNGTAYRSYPVNATQYPGWSRANRINPNPVGTITFIERLPDDGAGPLDPQTGARLAW